MVKKIDISPLKEPDPDLPPRSLLGRLGRSEKRLAKITAIYNTETKIKGFKGTEATHAGYNLDAAIKELNYVKSYSGEDWDDFFRLDNTLALNGCPKEKEFMLVINHNDMENLKSISP